MWLLSGGVTLKCFSSKFCFINKNLKNVYKYKTSLLSNNAPFHALPIYRAKGSIKIVTKELLSTKWQWV